jgi:hypothetical protein
VNKRAHLEDLHNRGKGIKTDLRKYGVTYGVIYSSSGQGSMIGVCKENSRSIETENFLIS